MFQFLQFEDSSRDVDWIGQHQDQNPGFHILGILLNDKCSK